MGNCQVLQPVNHGYNPLNDVQERAFRIITNHAVTPGSDQLIMYVGGMAGTGKSQVIKALMGFLNLEMNLTGLLFWHPQELQQLFCMAQLITQFWESLLMVKQL